MSPTDQSNGTHDTEFIGAIYSVEMPMLVG
jgi:hypothetical protein